MLIGLLLLGGCLERVTGEPVPLDSRFTAQPEITKGDDTGGPGHLEVEHEVEMHEEVGPPKPFSDIEGEMVLLTGAVVSGEPGVSVDLDVALPAPDQPGGLENAGKLILSSPGPFELSVPKGVGVVILRAFQDPDADGPSATDAYGELRVEVGDEAPKAVTVALVVGGLEQAFGHVEAPPGAGSEHAPHPTEGEGSAGPFADYLGELTTIRGLLRVDVDTVIDVDLFTSDVDQPGGRRLLGKFKRSPGAFSIDVPTEYGVVQLDVFADLDGDGPSPDDPSARTEMISIDAGPVNGVMLVLEIGHGEPPAPGEVGGGEDLEEAFRAASAPREMGGSEPDSP